MAPDLRLTKSHTGTFLVGSSGAYSLTVDNTSGTLPIDFSEVTITRRLFRTGDSEYELAHILVLVPEQATDLHLQLLSELAQMFSEKPFREKLAGAAKNSFVKKCTADAAK